MTEHRPCYNDHFTHEQTWDPDHCVCGGPLPCEDALSDNARTTLTRLRRGPASTVELQRDYPLVHVAKQIYELRQAGHYITTRRLPNRVAMYSLQVPPEQQARMDADDWPTV